MNRITPLASAVPVTMSSREIADLTGKQHQHIKRDIESMLADLGKDASSFGRIYQDILNRQQTEYALPKRECLILVSGYDVVMRARIIDRWLELEARITLPTAPSLPVLESSLVLACNGIPIRFLIDETGEWQATYKDVATVLGYVNKEQQYSARNVLKYTVKAGERQLRHPIYGDLISLAGIDRMVAQFERNAMELPERAAAGRALRVWLTTVAAPLVAQPASAGFLLSQKWTPPAGQQLLAFDPDFQQTAHVLTLWHEALGETSYRACDVLKLASGALADALGEVSRSRWFSTLLSAKRLGKWLSLRQGQIVDGLRIVSAADRSRKVRLWAVHA